MNQSQCAQCGAPLAPASGPTWSCMHCGAQYQAPALPEGYIWISNEGVHSLLCQNLTGVDSTFLHPSIPAKKLANVRKVHAAHLPADEPILGIYDGTAFGSANDGWVVTAQKLCAKNQMESAFCLRWGDVIEDQVWVEDNRIVLGQAKLDTLFAEKDHGLYAWAEVIRTIARSARGPKEQGASQHSSGASAALSNLQAWGGPEVLVAATGVGWGGTQAAQSMGAGIPCEAPRPDEERLAQPGYVVEKSVSVVDVHPSGEIFLAAGNGVVELRYAQNGQRCLAFPAPSTILSARFSPDGQWLLVGGLDSQAALFEARTGQYRGATPNMADGCDEVAWIGDTGLCALASQQGEVWIVDTRTMRVVKQILGKDPEYSQLGGIAVAPDGSRIFVSCGNKLGAFDVHEGTILWRAEDVMYDAARLSLSPRGDKLAMVGYGGVAMLDAQSGSLLLRYQFPCASNVSWPEKKQEGLLGKLRGNDKEPLYLSWSCRPKYSPNGNLIAVQDHVGNLCFIDGSSGALYPTPRVMGRAWIEDLAWFGDSNHLLLGTSDNRIAIWRVYPSLEGLLLSEGIGELSEAAYAQATYLSDGD